MTEELRNRIIEILKEYDGINIWKTTSTDGEIDWLEESDRGKTSDGLLYSKARVKQYLEENNYPINPKNIELVAKKLASESGIETKEVEEINTEIDSMTDDELDIFMSAKITSALSAIQYELIRQNYMEYKISIIPDLMSGGIDSAKLSEELSLRSNEGYRLKAAFTNELGKNKAGVGVGPVTVGLNATADQTVLIFERPRYTNDRRIEMDMNRIKEIEKKLQ